MSKMNNFPDRFGSAEMQQFLKTLGKKLPEKSRENLFEKHLLAQIEAHWQEIVGSTLATHTQPVWLSKGTLTVYADHSMFAQQCQMHAPQITEQIKKSLELEIQKLDARVQPRRRKAHSSAKTRDIMSAARKMSPTSTVKASNQQAPSKNSQTTDQDHSGFTEFLNNLRKL